MEGISNQDMAFIDEHLLGTLSDIEVEAFNERLKDPPFSEHLDFVKATKSVAEKRGDAAMRDMFKSIDANLDGQPMGQNRNVKRWLLIAGALALLAILLLYIFKTKKDTPEILYAEFYGPMPNMIAPIEKGGNLSSDDVFGFQNYERGNFAEAIKQFDASTIQNEGTIFYKALSQLALNQEVLALPILTQLSNDPEAEFAHAAEWYLMLAHLKLGNIKATKQVGKSIVTLPNHRYKSKAQDLLDRL